MYTFSAAFSSSLRTLPPEDRSLRCRNLAAALVAIAADRETLEDDDVTRSLALRCAPLADLPSLEERNELLGAASGRLGPWNWNNNARLCYLLILTLLKFLHVH
jgi:hypothetical protein